MRYYWNFAVIGKTKLNSRKGKKRATTICKNSCRLKYCVLESGYMKKDPKGKASDFGQWKSECNRPRGPANTLQDKLLNIRVYCDKIGIGILFMQRISCYAENYL